MLFSELGAVKEAKIYPEMTECFLRDVKVKLKE